MFSWFSSRIWHGIRLAADRSALTTFLKTTAVAVNAKTITGAPHSTTRRTLSSPRPRQYANMATLETLHFDNLALRSLPIDANTENYPRSVAGACFSLVKPDPVKNPRTVAYSVDAMGLLDLDEEELKRGDFPEFLSGNKLPPGADTAAHCYCGHQFGYFSGQLGDGATMYLGEVVNKKGERWEIQYKGAGKTPYSRTADGRKVLRSSIREFLCSEAIHFLGIPTTRAGSCVTSDTKVMRDIFYTGDNIYEQATIILRIAPTFLRFGSFEIFKTRDSETGRTGPSVGRHEILNQMLDYTVKNFFPEIWAREGVSKEDQYLEMYTEVVKCTARLVAEWQGVGWCHGVLNTDNMSILGLTIDYGPFGFMDSYDPDFICNHSDNGGRYTYAKQPEICRWNCLKLAEAIQRALPLSRSKEALKIYDEVYEEQYMAKMRKKLGLLKKSLHEDKKLIEDFFTTMQATGADFTNSFRCLSRLPLPNLPDLERHLEELKTYLVSQCSTVEELKAACKPRMDPRQLQMLLMLLQQNPDLLAQLGGDHRGIAAELTRMEQARDLQDLTQEGKTQSDGEKWAEWLNKYKDRLSEEVDEETDMAEANVERVRVMNATNPKFILRNYIAQRAIDAAEKGDFSEVRRVLRLLESPFSETVDFGALAMPEGSEPTAATGDDDANAASAGAACSRSFNAVSYDGRPPEWATDLKVT